jgi:hypothetical protein
MATGAHQNLFLASEAQPGGFDPNFVQVLFANGTAGQFVRRSVFNDYIIDHVHIL